MDIGFPFPARFDFVPFRDHVAELGSHVAVETEVGLFVEEGRTVRVFGDVAVGVSEGGARRSGEWSAGGGEGTEYWLAEGVQYRATWRVHF